MMEKYKLNSPYDNLTLDILTCKAQSQKALFVIAHGMAEHKERYISFMEYLALKGYTSLIYDHRGHGQSVKNNDDLGYFNDESSDAIVDDLAMVIDDAKTRYSAQKVILLGHSMGSMVVRKYLQKHDEEIDALIVCGSPSYNPLSKMALLLIDIMKLFKGDRYRSHLIQNLAFGSYNKGIMGESENRWLSYNEENVKNYDENELDGFIFTLNGFKNLFTLMQDTYDKKDYEVKNDDLPILFIAGHDDPVIIDEEKFKGAVDFIKNLGYKNVQAILYPKMRHEILNESDNINVYEDIINWIDIK